jgi:hypothetical protein
VIENGAVGWSVLVRRVDFGTNKVRLRVKSFAGKRAMKIDRNSGRPRACPRIDELFDNRSH